MSVLLSEPRTVLVVGNALATDQAREVLLSGKATDVVDAETAEGALDALDAREDVGCVVTAATLPDATGVELCQRISSLHPDVGVVFYVEDDAVSGPQTAVNAGADGYVSTDESPAKLRERVDSTLETAVRRLVHAEESDAFQTILDEIRLPMYVKDDEGRHLRLVDMPEGVDPEEAHGETDLDLYGDDDPELARSTYEDDMTIIENEQPVFNHDEHFESGDYDYWSRTTKVPWYDDDGEVKGLVGVSRDVTQLKRCEQELEALRDRFDQFASYLTHDLQNPLQVASGNLALAREQYEDDEALENVDSALSRMEEILEDLGSLAQSQRQGDSLLPRANLRAILTELWDVVATDEATLEVEFTGEPVLNEPEGSFRSVLENLLSNAINHGGSDVTVRVGQTDRGGVYVADDGPGIPEQKQEEVLEFGYTTAEDGTGTGLGIVTDVADQHGWRLNVTDSWAGGARFEIDDCLLVWEEARTDETEPIELTEQTAVGTLGTEPAAEYDPSADEWFLRADGANVWANENDFFYVHESVSEPVRITARVSNVDHIRQYSKAGIMIRSDLEEAASYGAICLTAGLGSELLWRSERGARGRSYQIDDEDDPYVGYRAEWDGETVTLSVTSDGEDWIATDQRPIETDGSVHVGLFICSVVEGHATTATIEDVDVTRVSLRE